MKTLTPSSIPATIPKAELFKAQVPEWPEDVFPSICVQIAELGTKIVVLDDDPTGCQTVHGVSLLTQWSIDCLAAELAGDAPVFFILANTRSLSGTEAGKINRAIAKNLNEASERTGINFVVISRGNSTLRGHFQVETEALCTTIRPEPDATLFIPFFGEGGRYTCDDIHYVQQKDVLLPVGETEAAQDTSFGFLSSHLGDWLSEQLSNSQPEISSISLQEMRSGGPHAVANRLLTLASGSICIVNALTRKDIEVFTAGALRAEARGRNFLYRSSASFVPVRAGITSRPLLNACELYLPDRRGGLIVVGSHVSRTTDQLSALRKAAIAEEIEVDVEKLAGTLRWQEIERTIDRADRNLRRGKNVLIFTSRSLVSGYTSEESLALSRKISHGIAAIVGQIKTRPRYLLAKGGITSHHIATGGLGMLKATVLGQIEAGIPVWKLGEETRFPDLTYVVFPGNVGDADTLTKLVQKLS